MNRWAVLLLALALALPLMPARGEEGEEPLAAARAFVQQLAEGKFAEATEGFDATMKSVMPAAALEGAWKGVTAKVGAFQAQEAVREQKLGEYRIVFVTCRFERTVLDTKVVFNPQGEIGGLWFVPSQPAVEYQPPDYARPDSFEERQVQVGPAESPLPGALTVPKAGAPEGGFPAVVLVHGSGPNDRDETIGPNKPFKDLAWGLASAGVAVLRYDKRTMVHPDEFGPAEGGFTVKEETVDDALAAAALLRAMDGIDPGKVFVLGHSLGGMLIPRIAEGGPDIAGFIVLAGTARPLEDVVLEQVAYVSALSGELTEREKEDLESIRQQVEKVRALGPADAGSPERLLGAPPAYWLDLRGYDPAEAAKGIDRPILILQGRRDYQVTMADFRRWRDALAGRANVDLKVYPALNHLFIAGEGKSMPAEYERAGHVARQVVDDLAGWIKTR